MFSFGSQIGSNAKKSGSRVMRLPEKYRIVIHLFYYEEYSIDEISATLRRSRGTVKSQLSRGRKLLKSMLTEVVCHD